ncbi:hypothetical protein [Microvirga pudoricolor]|uniref:hypothetical protein n=1 Tax=Microvirga pudoricolor TaxID=2778729 RepID=UPI00195132E2|nr:hypothetical protein [Microvirga pudoricolor]MBM6594530.1 hypothetical protein [Microvirga pudoricolor]
MVHKSPENFDWYEDDQPLDTTVASPVPGLPGSWSNYTWWLACIGFALVWIVESLGSIDSARGFASYSAFAGQMWNLMLVLGICYVIFRVSRPLSGLSYVLSGSAAAYLLLTHSF